MSGFSNFRNSEINISQFVYYLIPLYFIFDSLTIIIFKAGGLFTLIRGIIIYIFIIYSYTSLKVSKRDVFIFLLLFQTLFLLLYSNNILTSITISSKVFASLFMFPIGFHFISNEFKFQKLVNIIPWLLVIIIINFILGKFFGIGYDVYDKNSSLRLGNFSDNVNVFTYTLLIVPLFIVYSKGRFTKIATIIMGLLISIIILLAMKRVAIVGLLFGYFIFSLFTGEFFKNIRWISMLILILYLSMPLYQDLLNKRFYAREDRLKMDSIQEDGRVWETKIIWSDILSFKEPVKSILGFQTFNSPNNYANAIYKGRRLHVDYNEIVFGNGLIGLFLYLGIYFNIIIQYLKYRLKKMNVKYSIMTGVFWALILTSLFTSFSGQYYAITFRSIIFLFLGAILRQLYNFKESSINSIKV